MRIAALALLLLLAAPAGALTIQIDSVSLGPANTPDSVGNRSTAEVLVASDSVADVAGGPFAEVAARWAGTAFADGASPSRNATADWQITFSISASPGTVYDLVIFQQLVGGFSFVDAGAGNATGSVGPVTGTLAGLPNPLLTMPVGVDGSATSAGTASIPFQRSRLLELDNLVGNQTLTLAFRFDLSAQSALDEVAVQLGLPGDVAAASYPGIGLRDAAADGHFLSLQSRVIAAVPEPSTLPLVMLGLAALRRTRCR